MIIDQLYMITSHRKLHVTSKGTSGTIVHLSKNELQITTRTVDIAILKIMGTDRTIYDMEQLSTLCSLSVGHQ
jgi:hypothetical protein